MPTASGRMKFLITFEMATSSRRFRHRFSHIFFFVKNQNYLIQILNEKMEEFELLSH